VRFALAYRKKHFYDEDIEALVDEGDRSRSERVNLVSIYGDRPAPWDTVGHRERSTSTAPPPTRFILTALSGDATFTPSRR